jgi:hypothetical protein
MKSIISVGFTLLILFGGLQMHLTTHYCGGRLITAKINFTGETNGCGMEECTFHQNASGESVHKDCCRDFVSLFSLDEYQVDSCKDSPVPVKVVTHVAEPPYLCGNLFASDYHFTKSVIKPPGVFLPEITSSDFLCVFRI